VTLAGSPWMAVTAVLAPIPSDFPN
jgi:hypothetical protein